MEGVPPTEPISVAPVPAQPVAQMRLSLIPESKLREYMQKEKISQKKGKYRKLKNVEKQAIEEELQLFAFDPARFAEQIAKRFASQQAPPEEQAKAEAKAEEQLQDLSASVAEIALEEKK